MNYDLYFILNFIKAFENIYHTKQSFEKAFEEIEFLGRQEQYKIGYRQFCMFMYHIAFLKRNYSFEQLEQIIPEKFTRPNYLSIIIERNGIPQETLTFNYSGGIHTLKIIPGNYRLILDTGLRIWSARLTEANLIFDRGAGGDTLKVAASTDQRSYDPVKAESLFDDMIRLFIYPGFENGTMKIQVNKNKDDEQWIRKNL